MSSGCLSEGELAGAIIGSIVGTLFICILIAAALFYFFRKQVDASKNESKIALGDIESSPSIPQTPKRTMRDQVTMIESFKVERKNFGTQKSFSVDNVNEALFIKTDQFSSYQAEATVHIKVDDLNGLGFNIKGNMTDGIYVKSVVPKGPADLCGNILVDDRIRSLTISFDGMVYEDAVTLLSYASPYQVKFVLERKLDEGIQTIDSESSCSPRVHPLFRSNTLTHCHFNPCSPSPSPSPTRSTPPQMKSPSPSPLSPQPMGDRQTPPPVAAEPREPSPVAITEEVVPVVVVEPREAVAEAAHSPAPIESTLLPVTVRVEDHTEKKMESSDYSSDHSEKASETSSESLGSAHSIDEKIEVIPAVETQRVIAVPPSPPKPVAVVEKLPPKKISRESAIPIKRTPTQKRDGTSTSPPQIAETKVSRIPKRSDSMKTPVVERKLPPLPKSALQKRESTPENADIWSRLYQEKKGALRKTRTPEPMNEAAANVMTTSATSQKEGYGTLNRERREKLQENDEILEQQKEELRQLGIL